MTKLDYLEMAEEIESIDPELAAIFRHAAASGVDVMINLDIEGDDEDTLSRL